ncbi:MAG: carboxylesterase/lipase family protein [Caulobacteraceae bacterium]
MRTTLMSGAATLSLAVAACALLAAAPAQAALDKPVKTQNGLVSGIPGSAPGVTVFRGIPFGAPPVGPLRWREPQPVANWTGVRDGSKWGDACIQPSAKTRALGVNLAIDLPDSPKMSEDCLNLNVWTPATKAGQKLPVMVWVYGGAYNEGGGNMPISDGNALAKKGVIIVTFNYRVGAFGFLSHPELTKESGHNASGNQALADSIAALKWVKANIAAFGGDPDNVTIFGQSAGACIDAFLVGSPQAKGLFKRSISESGEWMGLGIAKMAPRERQEQATVAAAEKAGAKSLADMRAMSPEAVMKAFRNQGGTIDGYYVPEDLSKTFAEGRQNPVDVLVGSNGTELSFGGGQKVTVDSLKTRLTTQYKDLAPLALAAYAPKTDDEAVKIAAAQSGDTLAWGQRLYADDMAKIGKQSWLYHFTFHPPGPPNNPDPGPTHASEIAYVFNNLEKPHEIPDAASPELSAKDPKAIKLADQMGSYWTNFAKTGNPNGPGLPKWPSVKELKPGETMVLDVNPGKGEALTDAQIALYKAVYDRDVGIH